MERNCVSNVNGWGLLPDERKNTGSNNRNIKNYYG